MPKHDIRIIEEISALFKNLPSKRCPACGHFTKTYSTQQRN